MLKTKHWFTLPTVANTELVVVNEKATLSVVGGSNPTAGIIVLDVSIRDANGSVTVPLAKGMEIPPGEFRDMNIRSLNIGECEELVFKASADGLMPVISGVLGEPSVLGRFKLHKIEMRNDSVTVLTPEGRIFTKDINDSCTTAPCRNDLGNIAGPVATNMENVADYKVGMDIAYPATHSNIYVLTNDGKILGPNDPAGGYSNRGHCKGIDLEFPYVPVTIAALPSGVAVLDDQGDVYGFGGDIDDTQNDFWGLGDDNEYLSEWTKLNSPIHGKIVNVLATRGILIMVNEEGDTYVAGSNTYNLLGVNGTDHSTFTKLTWADSAIAGVYSRHIQAAIFITEKGSVYMSGTGTPVALDTGEGPTHIDGFANPIVSIGSIDVVKDSAGNWLYVGPTYSHGGSMWLPFFDQDIYPEVLDTFTTIPIPDGYVEVQIGDNGIVLVDSTGNIRGYSATETLGTANGESALYGVDLGTIDNILYDPKPLGSVLSKRFVVDDEPPMPSADTPEVTTEDPIEVGGKYDEN